MSSLSSFNRGRPNIVSIALLRLFGSIIIIVFNAYSISNGGMIATAFTYNAPTTRLPVHNYNIERNHNIFFQSQQRDSIVKNKRQQELQHYTFRQRISRPTTSSRRGSSTSLKSAISIVPLSLVQKVAVTCFVPTLLGYYRSEYGVSYAYGLATSVSAMLVLLSNNHAISLLFGGNEQSFLSILGILHSSAVAFYGIRLILFLAYRELRIPRFQKMVQTIEDRAIERTKNKRILRTPFIVSCALLYLGLVSPLLLTYQLLLNTATTATFATNIVVKIIFGSLLIKVWFGFLLGAIGDIYKSYVKAVHRNSNNMELNDGNGKLVTSGVFSMIRHPNYSGEMIAWTSNGLIGMVSGLLLLFTNPKKLATMLPTICYIMLSMIGVIGINFVLLQATANLERKQKEMYGSTQEYTNWIQSSWCGFSFNRQDKKPVDGKIEYEI